MLSIRFFMALPILIGFSCISVETPEKHADYVVLGKSINHRQSPEGELTLLNTVFFGEIFRTGSGTVENGYLSGPGEASSKLRFSEGDVLFLAGERLHVHQVGSARAQTLQQH